MNGVKPTGPHNDYFLKSFTINEELEMKSLRFGIAFVLLLTLPALATEEVPQVEAPLAKEPLQIIVTGVHGGELKNVQAAIALPTGLVREGKVDRQWLERFKNQIPDRVRRALEPFGYYHVKAEVSLEIVPGGIYQINVEVEPGRPVRVTSVNVSIHGPGAEESALRKLWAAFPLKKGDVLHHQKYEEAKGTLRTEALNLGYLDADFSVHVIRVYQIEYSAEIKLILETGPRYYFGDIRLEGAPEYPERFLMRYFAFQSGEAFSYPKIFQTQINLNNSDRFREVILLAEREVAKENHIPVRVKLAPSRAKRLRIGIGYSTDSGARITGNYQDLNFNHRGHELHVEANVSERLQNFIARYVIPSLSDLESFTSFKGGVEQERVKTYEKQAVTLEFEHTRSLGKGRLGSGYLRVRREDFEVGIQEGRSRLVMPGLRFNERRYDDLIRPKKGYRYEAELRGTGEFLGSDTSFLQFLVSGDLVVSLPLQFVLFARGQGGFTLLSDPLRELPPSVRFFAGGDRSIRGYAYQSLGPRDAIGQVVGGKHLLVGSVEIERAITRSWALAAFYDVGNAFNHFGKIDPQHGAGLGIRLYTPVGPIRLDLAYQLGVKDPDFRIHLSVGFGL
jgi:translocation and assembly module TamA